MKLNHILGTAAVALLAACSQGSDIASPGASNPGTPPGGGGSGSGGGGGGSTATCPSGFTTGTPVGNFTTCDLSGTILTNTTLPAVSGIAYRLSGRVDVGADIGADGSKTGGAPAVLTIEPGVVIFGSSGEDHLVVNRGSRIEAAGSASSPIVFTSAADLGRQADSDPSNDDGGSSISEWGGLVILGRAPINRCAASGVTPGTADCENAVEGVTNPDAIYGGGVANDDSGTLRFVQVRFAGFPLSTGNELNGISFGGVGTGTEVDFVQVHNNSDDGIEMFGGAVNLKHIVLTGNDDDSFDTDNGWNGNVQFLLAVQRPDGGDNIFEASSVAPGTTPLSNGQISNFTVVGDRTNAWRLNTGTVGKYMNGVVNYGKECMRWQTSAGDGVAGFSAAGDPNFNSVLFDCDNGLFTTTVQHSDSDEAAPVAAAAADANNVTGADSLAANFFPGPNELAVTPFDPTTVSSFFSPVTYIGAFSPSETETQNWAAGWTFNVFPDPSCPAGTTDTATTIAGTKVCRLSGTITTDLRLTRGVLYEIDNRVDVGVDVGADGAKAGGVSAELTIEAGVVLFGDEGSDHMVVNRGSKLFANGTLSAPVVFTSENDVTGTQSDAVNAIGEWGGLVILGRAPINRCAASGVTPGTVDCENAIEGVTNPDAIYGGGIADDSSGSLKYVQVKHSGFPLSTGNELNGISFGGVGTGTEVDYVQVHNSSDDGIEMFGGTVNLKHIVLTGNDDDSLDTDNGWNGNLQYLIITQRSAGGDNGFEASSVAPGTAPLSNAKISNFTVVGDRTNAWRLNTGTVGKYMNGVVNYGKECMRWQTSAGDGVAGFSAAGDPNFNSVLFDCDNGLFTTTVQHSDSDEAAPVAAAAADANNTTAVADTLTSVFVNGTAEAAVTPFDPTTVSSFFEATDHIGAVKDASDTWWQGWSCGLQATDPC
ncbi:MAG: hypothetical protein KDA53_07615 [Hyphomonas sp.]|nr:hypothetical protein [Hyphomonas sp.]